MSNSRLAARYAKSLLDLAHERNLLSQVASDVHALGEQLEHNRDLRLLTQSPVIRADIKRKVLREVLGNQVQPLTLSFVELLTKNRRESDLQEICREYAALYARYRNIQQVVVTSARPLDDTLRKAVMDLAKKQAGTEVELSEKTNPSLIGGFILQIGDKMFDQSVHTRIRKVRQTLTETKI
jgi:F-type H+-transporting ATPase subunit delta